MYYLIIEVNVDMPMRVIGGIYKHRKLVYPESNPLIRPTKDRIREALFSILGDLENKLFLDLYAGCGSIGIEAISRGAKKSYFVDKNKESIKYIKENINALKIADQAEVLNITDEAALYLFKEKNMQFDVIYLDPPYKEGNYIDTISYILNNNLISEEGIIISEVDHELNIIPSINQIVKKYHYGKIDLIVLRNIKK